MDINFVTSNDIKYAIAEQIIKNTSHHLYHTTYKTIEIQSMDVEKVVQNKARYLYDKLGVPIAVTDAGFYIEALNGFPGALVKYINSCLSPNNILKMLDKEKNRNIVVRESICILIDDRTHIKGIYESKGIISNYIGRKEGSTIEKIAIPTGYTVPMSELGKDIMMNYWIKNSSWWTVAHFGSAVQQFRLERCEQIAPSVQPFR